MSDPDDAPDAPLTYAKAGVDIDEEADTIQALVASLTTGRDGAVQPLELPGHFAGGVQLGEQALILCTDGVGSKVEIARALDRYDTIGIDCMAMNVNDAICIGAEPVAFVDYLAIERHSETFATQVGQGLAEGARQANVAIVGGETATLPGIVKGFDLAGTCLATAPMDQLITGQEVAPGDVLIGLPSSGIHSNGLTLARKAVERAGLSYTDTVPELEPTTIGEALLEPTRIYVRPILELIQEVDVHGLVHVTGGGVHNYPRIRDDVGYVLDELPEPPAIFEAIQRLGGVEDREMYRTFNMGIGFCAVVAADDAAEALAVLGGQDAQVIGRVEEGAGVEVSRLGLGFSVQ